MLRQGEIMKKLTQDVFKGAPDWVKSAAVDSDGTAYLYNRPKSKLSTLRDYNDEGIFYAKKPYVSWMVVGEYDATDWQNSAIDREVVK